MFLYKKFIKDFATPSILKWALLITVLLVFNATNSSAGDVTFVWTANSETVEGYRLYYKTGSSGAPYNGTGATEGPSPVVTGNVQTFTLHDLSDTETYYFTLTAYLGAEESNYSDEIVYNSPPNLSIID